MFLVFRHFGHLLAVFGLTFFASFCTLQVPNVHLHTPRNKG